MSITVIDNPDDIAVIPTELLKDLLDLARLGSPGEDRERYTRTSGALYRARVIYAQTRYRNRYRGGVEQLELNRDGESP